jgi:hypothetical protein
MSNTGPNTPEGKAVVSRNAIRHGLRAEQIVLPEVESEEDWEDHRRRIFASLEPVGGLEEEFTERVAILSWRLRRGPRAERDAVIQSPAGDELSHNYLRLAAHLHDQIFPEDPLDTSAVLAAADGNPGHSPSLPGERPLNKIMRYEAQYSRQLLQTINALRAIQEQRRRRRSALIHLATS